jgi:transcriptional regulator of acetoin/glycerol metabolism
MAATQIENGLFRECHRGDIIIAFHSRAEYLHTLSAGLLAVDRGGQIRAVNARAGFLLHGLPAARGAHFRDLFRTPFDALLHAARDDERQRLEDRVGSTFAAKLENVPRARPVAVPTSAPTAPRSFVADDPAVTAILRQVENAAARKLPILIRGATGTGKEQLARHAHQASGRRGAFVPVNCAGLPDTLVEAELFGHADGAFTGARRGGSPGLVVESDGGTLFLDEIGDMKLSLQSVLLRLLDDWSVRPVGGGKRRQVDVLLVAATNVDLEQAVEAGRFRADLFYRLNTVDVVLPQLADRRDFAAIARHLLTSIAPDARITDAALTRLAARPWPGNVRELRSVLTRLTLADPSREIGPECLSGLCPVPAEAPTGGHSLRALLTDQVRAVHRELDGNIAETARRLGVSRNTVYRALGAPARGARA